MSIRQGLLALLAEAPRHGYQLRAEFEARTGGTWPLNVGQVYTTLQRLERDGFVRSDGHGDVDRAERASREDRVVYELTDAGRQELAAWWTTPVRPETRPRDELAIKLALAVTAPGVDVHRVVQAQRTDTLRALQEYTRLRLRADADGDLAWLLVLDSLIFAAEAEVRWLDHCETGSPGGPLAVTRPRAARPRPAPPGPRGRWLGERERCGSGVARGDPGAWQRRHRGARLARGVLAGPVWRAGRRDGTDPASRHC